MHWMGGLAFFQPDSPVNRKMIRRTLIKCWLNCWMRKRPIAQHGSCVCWQYLPQVKKRCLEKDTVTAELLIHRRVITGSAMIRYLYQKAIQKRWHNFLRT